MQSYVNGKVIVHQHAHLDDDALQHHPASGCAAFRLKLKIKLFSKQQLCSFRPGTVDRKTDAIAGEVRQRTAPARGRSPILGIASGT